MIFRPRCLHTPIMPSLWPPAYPQQRGGLPTEVHDQNCLRIWRYPNPLAEDLWRHNTRPILDVEKNRFRSQVPQDLCGCGKGHRRNEDFITFAYANCLTGEMKSRGPGVDAAGISRSYLFRKSFLEFKTAAGGCKPARFRVSRIYSSSFPSHTIRQKGIFLWIAITSPIRCCLAYCSWEHESYA